MSQWLFALAAVASLALIGVGCRGLLRPRGSRVRPGLMVAAGLVTLLNVWLATLPV